MKKLQMSQCGLSLSYTHTRAHTFLWQATFFKGNCIDAPHVNTQKRGFFFEFWVQTMPLPSPHLQGLVWAPVASLLSYPELIHESFIILLCITILVIRIGVGSQDEGEGEIWKTINLITGFWPRAVVFLPCSPLLWAPRVGTLKGKDNCLYSREGLLFGRW